MPVHLWRHQQRLVEAIRSEQRQSTRRTDPRASRISECMYALRWPGMQPATLDSCLLYMGRLIDAYTKSKAREVGPAVPDGRPPAWRPYLLPVGLVIRHFIPPKKRNRIGKWG